MKADTENIKRGKAMALAYLNKVRGGDTGREVLTTIPTNGLWWKLYGKQWVTLANDGRGADRPLKPEGFP